MRPVSGSPTVGRWGTVLRARFILGPCLICFVFFVGAPVSRAGSPADIEVFTRAGCPHCAAATRFLNELQRERPTLRIAVQDIGQDPQALARLKDLAARFDVHTLGVPAFYLRGQLIIGFVDDGTTGARLRALLDQPPEGEAAEPPAGACLPETTRTCDRAEAAAPSPTESIETPWMGRLNTRDLGLPLFTVIIGLLDGFNPCAMWALLFLLSLLVNLQDRVKMALVAGTFVAVSGLIDFAFMAAWLNLFLLIGLSRTVQVILGGAASLIGIVNLKDFVALGRGPSLSIPEAAKPGFYAGIRRVLQAEHLGGALIGVATLAVLVNLIELLCTAGFPAVYTQILALRSLSWWEYYGYLGLYNLAYILDDSLMVAIAVVTLGRRKLQEREGRWLKLVSGAVMLGLGAILILKPEWLGN